MPYQWTIMIYMAGDNDLEQFGLEDLYEMKRVGSTGEVAILAQFDRPGFDKHTKRYFVKSDKETQTIEKDEVGDLGETNTGDPEELTRFILWGMGGEYAAQRYLVILWGHAAGVNEEAYYPKNHILKLWENRRHGLFRPRVGNDRSARTRYLEDILRTDVLFPRNYAFGPDAEARDFLDNFELKRALNDVGHRIDILGMDACLMSMAEICYQLRQSVEITVASESQTGLEGWPYESFIRKLVQHPSMSPRDLARIIVEDYKSMYQKLKRKKASLAACNIAHVELIRTRVNKLAEVLLSNLNQNHVLAAITHARSRVWTDDVVNSIDLYDFCQLLASTSDNADVSEACLAVTEVLSKDDFIFSRCRVGKEATHCNGLAIYFPKRWVTPTYPDLDFVHPDVTRWYEFIDTYLDRMKH